MLLGLEDECDLTEGMQMSNTDQPDLKPDDEVFSATKLVAALNVLNDLNIDCAHAFTGTTLTLAQLADPNAKISRYQQIRAFRNISDAASDPALPFLIGQSVHVSAYGLFGYAILCSKDYATAASFAQKYHDLAAPLIEMEFIHSPQRTGWRIMPLPHVLVDDDFYAFLLNLHIGIFLTLHKDIFGPDFHPDTIELTSSASARFTTPDSAATRVVFGAKENTLHIPPHHVKNPLVLSNDHTYRQIEQICQNELGGLLKNSGLSGRIRSFFLGNPGRALWAGNLEDVATHFQLTSRTLRRHLKAEGNSLRSILDSVRSEVAVRYLRENRLTNEEIANILGFSDSASFGRAFRRWTDRAPREYRGIE